MATVQERLQSLITAANTTTGKTDADMTEATQSLIDGFGSGSAPNGSSWVKINTGNQPGTDWPPSPNAICYFKGMLIKMYATTIGNSGIYTSTDGVNWVERYAFSVIRYCCTKDVIIAANNDDMVYSYDGIKWEPCTPNFYPNNIVYDGVRFIASSGDSPAVVYTSYDGATWESVNSNYNHQGSVAIGAGYVLFHEGRRGESEICYSSDLKKFEVISLPFPATWVGYANGLWIAFSPDTGIGFRELYTSQDLRVWEPTQAHGGVVGSAGILECNGWFYVWQGYNAGTLRTKDFRSFESVDFTGNLVWPLLFSEGRYIACTTTGIHYSPDGKTWKIAQPPTSTSGVFSAVATPGKLFANDAVSDDSFESVVWAE